MAKVYESDVPFVRRGQKAKMTLDSIPGRAYEGTITYVYPYLQAGTRETPVRLEFANPGYDLKPGMYATVEIRSELAKQAILVPDTAVIDTGERKVAYVVRAPGKFEPRELSIGARSGAGDLQVLSGVAPGEKIVVSGQFLLDSESRLREASLKMLAPGAVATQP
jgi:RND family efflux transporter MFP subunit